MIVLGDPGTGKTGGLASLVKAGYKLAILDYDNGLDILRLFIEHECPDKIDNVIFKSLRDKYKMINTQLIVDGPPKAFTDGLKLLDEWPDYGKPSEWGPEWVLVVDSLTHCGRASFDWAKVAMPKNPDPRAAYFFAQTGIEAMLADLTSEYFRTNVIVITHVNYVDTEDGKRKGYPNAIGSALSPKIGSWFNSMALCTMKGKERVIQTAPTGQIDLKNPAPFAMLPEYPISTGLAEFFKVLKKPETNKPTPTKPTAMRPTIVRR